MRIKDGEYCISDEADRVSVVSSLKADFSDCKMKRIDNGEVYIEDVGNWDDYLLKNLVQSGRIIRGHRKKKERMKERGEKD
jgi:hypothetical protein